jgi:ornithine cyclodeaminase/alanine dehydrogenase-like protein (mu-crystallin family)
MPLLFLNHDEVTALLPMGECIEVMAGAFAALARGEARQPLRSLEWLPDRRGLLGLMPGQIAGHGEGAEQGDGGVLGIKVITVFFGNHALGEESHQGAVMLFEARRGKPIAVLDAAAITAIRTAAVSALATRLLARPEAGDLALLGTGVQARTHLAALREVRPLARVRVWSRTPERARRFAEREAARHGIAVEAVATAREAVAGADLICTVTAATEPVLRGDWIAPGAHVNAVGACTPNARELDTAAVARARLFADSRESVLNEAGDFLIPRREGAVDDSHIQGELADVVAGRVAGRRSADEVTLFESLGIAVEDLAAGHYLYKKALAAGRGTTLELAPVAAAREETR